MEAIGGRGVIGNKIGTGHLVLWVKVTLVTLGWVTGGHRMNL